LRHWAIQRALNRWNWTAGSESDILSHMLEAVRQYDRQAQLQPLLAESVEMNSANGLDN